MAYIHYDSKSNGVTYASVYESYREAGKVETRRIETLGRVVDKDNGIFSRRGKTFKYTVGEGKTAVPDTILAEPIIPQTEKLILDFGDAWFSIVCLPISRKTAMPKSGTRPKQWNAHILPLCSRKHCRCQYIDYHGIRT